MCDTKRIPSPQCNKAKTFVTNSRTPLYLLDVFDNIVWVSLVLAICVIPLMLTIVSTFENRITLSGTIYWTKLDQSVWYTLGTLLGENITRKHLKNAWAVRCIGGGWSLFALVIMFSYGGSLRAHLLKPRQTDTIDTVPDIVNSGLSWYMPFYGESYDRLRAGRDDDDLKRFWDENSRTDSAHTDFPYESVRKHVN